MDYAIFVAVLLLQSSMILYPQWLNAALFFHIPRQYRMDPARHVPIAAIALLLFMVLFFDAAFQRHPRLFPAPSDAATIPLRYFAGGVFAIVGLFFCSRPARALKRLVPRLRGVSELAIEDNLGLIRFAKVVGIVLLVGGAYWLFRILE
jgi:hypothetical protein